MLPLRCLTFELSRHRRHATSPRPQKMYTVPVAGDWWHAVGARLERGVRPQRTLTRANRSDETPGRLMSARTLLVQEKVPVYQLLSEFFLRGRR